MRLGFVRSFRLAVVTAVLLATACDSTPTDFDTTATDRLEVNPTYMVIPGGRTQKLDVRAVNAGRQATYADVISQISNCGEAAAIVVDVDPDQLDLQPPGKLIVTGETELGANCIALSADGARDTVDVVVTADEVAIDAAPTLLRAGQTGLVETRIITFEDSLTMTPFDLSHVIFTSDDSDVAAIDATGFVTTETAGSALLTVTWVPDSTGIVALAGTGTTRVTSTALDVVANVPDSAFLSVGSSFGAFAPPDTTTAEVVVIDAFGNQNTNPAEILDIFAESDNLAVATIVIAEIRQIQDPVTGEISARAFVEVAVEGIGIANISGTVTTSTGVFDWGAPVIGADPVPTSLVPSTGVLGTFVEIAGDRLAGVGLTTEVTADGDAIGDIFIVSITPTLIEAYMPDLGDAGDYEIGVSVGGVPSGDTFTWTQIGDEAPDEPDNNDPTTATPVTLPLDLTGSFSGGDVEDFYLIDLPAGGDLTVVVEWTSSVAGKDQDLIVQPAATAIQIDDGQTQYGNDECGNTGATFPHPPNIETATCTGLAAGEYVIHLFDWDGNYGHIAGDVEFRITATQP
jgi:hypothetical protein